MKIIAIFLIVFLTSCDSEKKTDAVIIQEEYSRQNKSLLDNKSTTDTTIYRDEKADDLRF